MFCGFTPVSSHELLGSAFGRTDFSRIFIFGPPDFFADFLAGFFLLIFVGKSAQKNPPGKSPPKSSKFCTTKIPDTFLQRGRAKSLFKSLEDKFVEIACLAPMTPINPLRVNVKLKKRIV